MSPVSKLLLRIFWLVLPFILVFAVLEAGLPKVVNSYNKKQKRLSSERLKINTLILGNSHAIKGINPAVLGDSCYNLGNVSQSLFYDVHLALKYLDSLPELKEVIIPVSYSSLYINLSETSEYWREEYYYRYWQVKSPAYEPGTERFSLTMLYTPKMALSLALKGFNTDLVPEINMQGFQLTDTMHHFYSAQTGKERIDFHHSIMKAENAEPNLQYLDTLLAALASRHIRPVLVTLPVYHTYSVHMKPEIRIANTVSLTSLAGKYGCTYVDYTNSRSFGAEDFLDNDHLNIRGANKMALMLKAL